jgi:hypothetical protein
MFSAFRQRQGKRGLAAHPCYSVKNFLVTTMVYKWPHIMSTDALHGADWCDTALFQSSTRDWPCLQHGSGAANWQNSGGILLALACQKK